MNQAGGNLNFFSPEVKVSVRKKGKKLIREMEVGSRQTETVLETTGMPHSDLTGIYGWACSNQSILGLRKL